MSAGVVFQQMLVIFLLIMTGYVLYKKEIIRGDISRGISALVVNVCNPSILLRSAFERDPSITADKLLLAAFAGLVLFGTLILSSFVIPWILRAEHKWRNHYAMLCIFGNTGFIGIPLVSAVLGSKALIYVAIVNAYYNIIFYTYGIWLADSGQSRFSWKNFLNIGNISIVLTLIIFFVQPPVPAAIVSTIDYMADTTTFLAMTVIGISLARTELRLIFARARMYILVVLRFLLLPVLISIVLRMLIRDTLVYSTMVLMAAVPVGNLPLMRVEEIGGDGQVLSAGIILSTILSLFTIPIVTLFV